MLAYIILVSNMRRSFRGNYFAAHYLQHGLSDSGGATAEGARSNDLAGRSTALAPPCLLLCFGNSVYRELK